MSNNGTSNGELMADNGVNGRVEEQESVAILDAGAQYGKVRYSANVS